MKKIILLFLFLSPFVNSCEISGDPALLELMLEIKNQNDALKEELKSLQAKSDSLINDLKTSSAKQEELLKKVTELQLEMAKVLSEIGKLTELLNKQNADLDAIKIQLADLQEKYNGILKQLEQLQKLSQILSEIEKLKGQLLELDGKYQVILGSLTQNTEQLNALKSQIAALQSKLEENLKKISELTSQLGEQGANIGEILSQLLDLLESIEEIKSQLNAILENGNGEEDGNDQLPNDGTVKDIEGNIYKVVKIGNQIWMAENLKASKFSNGDPIPTYIDRFIWEWGFAQNSPQFNPEVFRNSPAYCFYNNDAGVNGVYGKLYNWYTASDSRNVCPDGWRVSSDQDWTTLQTFVGLNVGDKLRKKGTEEWNSPNSNATDEFGFSAVPSGARVNEGFFAEIGSFANFWTPSGSIAYFRSINVNSSTVIMQNPVKLTPASRRKLTPSGRSKLTPASRSKLTPLEEYFLGME